MKNIPENLQAQLDSEVTTLAFCWKITFQDDEVLGFTSHDEDIIFNDVEAISVTYKAQNLIPYAVADFNAVKDDSGDITFSWIRRSREFSAWRDYVDMPLSESAESYKVEIIDDLDQVVRAINASTNSAIYTVADQTEDFGISQNVIKTRVYQISETVGKGIEIEKTFNF